MKTKKRTSKLKKNVTRVTVDFPKAQHRKLKALAAMEGVTLQDYIRSRVLPQAGELSEKEFQPIVDGIIDAYQDVLKRLSDK